MRRTLMFLVALAVSVAPAWSQTAGQASKPPAAKADHSADDQEIAKLYEGVQTALNNHDAKAMAATYVTDGDLRTPTGDLVRGRAAIEKYYATQFAANLKNMKATISSAPETRYLGANVAIWNGSADISGIVGPDGKELPPYKGLATNVMVKRNGSWQVLSGRVWPANPIPGPAPAKKTT